MKRSEFARVLGIYRAAWPDRALDQQAAEVWYDLLADLPDDTALVAVKQLARTSKFAPAVAELRAAALALSPDAPRDWEQAWGELVTQARRYGWNNRPTIDDPALLTVVADFGGWQTLCLNLDAADTTQRAQFRDLYTLTARRHAAAAAAGMHLDDPDPIGLPPGFLPDHELPAIPSTTAETS